MALVRWQPFREASLFDRDFASYLDRALGAAFALSTPQRMVAPMDVVRSGDDLLVRVELPGIDVANDVDISVEDRMLYICGTRDSSRGYSDDDVVFRESTQTSFSRTLPLPEAVGPDDVSADYVDGVLEIRVKGGARAAEKHEKRRIEVRSVASPSPKEAPASQVGAHPDAD